MGGMAMPVLTLDRGRGPTDTSDLFPIAPVELPKSGSLADLTPTQTAERLVEWASAKSNISKGRLITLGVVAGIFIALGGAFFTAVMSELSLTHGPSRLLGGFAFSTGLLLVCISGAELSTGNCMIVAAWASRRLTFQEVRRNLLVSYPANAAGG